MKTEELGKTVEGPKVDYKREPTYEEVPTKLNERVVRPSDGKLMQA
jgi:hypothetical protein